MRTRFDSLDGLRFVGALMVLTTHVGFESGAALHGPFAGLLSRLDAGVALFFVVSGFLLTRPHVMAHLEGRPRPRPAAYYLRRAARILPVLWVAVALAWLLVRSRTADVGDYLAHAGLVHTFLGTPYTEGLTQFWSLSVEVSFYLVLPFVAALLCRGATDRRWVRRVTVALLVVTALGPAWMATATAAGASQWRLWLPGYVGWFAVGMLLAVWHAARTTGLLGRGRLDTMRMFPGTMWSAAAATIAIAGTALAGPYDLSEPSVGQAATKNVLYTVFGFLVVLPAVAAVRSPHATRAESARSHGRVLRGRLFVWLGTISYGIFGYHVIVLELISRADGYAPFEGRFWIRWVVTLVTSVVLAAVSYYALERPVMRWARRRPAYSGDRSPAAAAASTTEALTPSQTRA